MRPSRGPGGAGNGSNTAATDFVQDYAAKRQAQLERARQIREERLHQQRAREASGAGTSQPRSPPPSDSFGRPPSSSVPGSHLGQARSSAASANAPASSSSAILQITEDDFKKATQTGIITPDQARQLWAMLSNQAVRVAAGASGGSAHNFPSTGLDRLLALSTPFSSSSSSAGGSQRQGTGNKDVDAGMSVSLESLRHSIAQFKEQQRRMKGGAAPRAAPARPQRAPSQRQSYGAEYPHDDMDEPHEEPDDGQEEEQEDPNAIFYRDDGDGRGGKKPAWNFDTAPVDDFGSKPRADPVKGKPAGGAKRTKAPPQPPRSQKPAFRTDFGNNDDDDDAAAHERDYAEDMYSRDVLPHKTGPSASSSSPSGPTAGKRRTPGGASGAAGRAVRPPVLGGGGGGAGGGAPLNLDDMPVGGGSGFNVNPYPDDEMPAMARGKPAPNRGGGGAPTSVPDIPMTNEEIAAAAAAAAAEPQRPCSICGRSFRVSVLPRHEKVCAKSERNKRKVFDVKGMRLDGVEGIQEVQGSSSQGYGNKNSNHRNAAKGAGGAAANKMPKWKIQHEQFQAAMRAVQQQKAYEDAVKESNAFGGGGGAGGRGGKPLPPPPPPMPLAPELDDRVPCPHCGRKFAEEVAERHIPKCATTVAKPRGIRPIRR